MKDASSRGGIWRKHLEGGISKEALALTHSLLLSHLLSLTHSLAHLVGEESWRGEAWRRNHGGGIMGMESWERNHKGGISWGRNRNLMGEESWGSCHEEQSWRRNRGVTMSRNHNRIGSPSYWSHIDVILRASWDHFGVILWSSCGHFVKQSGGGILGEEPGGEIWSRSSKSCTTLS